MKDLAARKTVLLVSVFGVGVGVTVVVCASVEMPNKSVANIKKINFFIYFFSVFILLKETRIRTRQEGRIDGVCPYSCGKWFSFLMFQRQYIPVFLEVKHFFCARRDKNSKFF